MITRKNISKQSDDQLVLLYKKRQSQLVLGELYERYSHLVYGLCLKYLKHVPEAQDMVMVVFEKLTSDLVKHDIKVFKGWLYTKTKNECLMLLRKKNPTTISSTDIQLEDDGMEEILNKKKKEEVYTNLTHSIEQLKDIQRICITLFYLEKKSYNEIEDQTPYTYKEIKSAIQNGKRNLKLIMEKQTTNY